ncbi:hypothetical protein Tfer_1454 [Thermincola ferriacetica]|uniref:Uncharacterized protein n=1 Tax=Thermincola ferriacetica TaxID=281456 RepID=A0A0L6W431_9FIRM|nr:hypothetical protein Tfer_1454 [Thermincola ferriacetica]
MKINNQKQDLHEYIKQLEKDTKPILTFADRRKNEIWCFSPYISRAASKKAEDHDCCCSDWSNTL